MPLLQECRAIRLEPIPELAFQVLREADVSCMPFHYNLVAISELTNFFNRLPSMGIRLDIRLMAQVASCMLALIFNALSLGAQVQLDSTTVQVSPLVTGLDTPWDMALSADGMVWVTEVDGTISRLDPSNNAFETIYTVPEVETFGFSAGMHSMVTHPDFENSPYIYVHYLYTQTASRIERYTYDPVGQTLVAPLTLLESIPGGASHNGSRMVIVDDKLLISLGDGFMAPDEAQDLSSLSGSVLRMELDGSVPADNPIAGSLIWSWGHRNPQGLCMANGLLYSSEHGTTGDDELNIIEPNRNYGWPEVEGYCDQASETAFCAAENVREPIRSWSPSIAPCGIDHYDGQAIPEWNNSILMAVLKDKKLIQMKLSEDGTEVLEEHSFFVEEYGRLRDVLCLPDGRVLICTTNHDFFGDPGPDDDRILAIEAGSVSGVQEHGTMDFSISPNPNTGSFSITGPVASHRDRHYDVELLDTRGVEIWQGSLSGLHTEVQIGRSELPSGVYFVRLAWDAEVRVIRMVVD